MWDERSLADEITAPSAEPTPLVPGKFDVGDRVLIGGEEKIGKSFFALQKGLCLAAGIPFLDWEPSVPLRVYYLQLEVSHARALSRMRRVAESLGITERPPTFYLASTRTWHYRRYALRLATRIRELSIQVLIIDPLYLFKPFDIAENDSGQMADFFVNFDETFTVGCNLDLVDIVHHFSKFNLATAERRAIQRMRGTGVLGGWCDAFLGLLQSDDDPLRYLVYNLRNAANPPTLVLEFDVETCTYRLGNHY